ncbi:MAG: hypothetical protein CVU44_11210 [Chloroflexi bacterium HGW-Chloroflexi-6]|nr:MAG: hypothetical protein CVU44_11210 [Chloroflexi bacterium HGW-Chloroflexi-6]
MKEMSITTLYGYVAPYAAPVPSAVVLGVNVYHSILSVIGAEYWWLAAIAAFIGMVGIESTGGLSAILVSRAFVHKSWSIMGLAMAAVVAYASFVAWGIYSSEDSKPMITTVAITLLAYFVVALWEGMKTLDQMKAHEISAALSSAQIKVTELDAEIRRMDAERKLRNSEIRLAKASNLSSGQSQASSGQVDTSSERPTTALNPSILEAARVFFESNPKASGRAWLESAGCPVSSPTTASRYKAAIDAEKREQA